MTELKQHAIFRVIHTNGTQLRADVAYEGEYTTDVLAEALEQAVGPVASVKLVKLEERLTDLTPEQE